MGRCKFVVTGSKIRSFPVSRAGWMRAVKAASKGSAPADIHLSCSGDAIFVVSCASEKCEIGTDKASPTGPNAEKVIAGLAAKPKRRLSSAELTPAQKKFKAAAGQCKGSGDYRSCMSTRLGKKK